MEHHYNPKYIHHQQSGFWIHFCSDDHGWYVTSANGRQALAPGDWVVLEPAAAHLPLGAYPIKPAIFAELYCQVGD